MDGSVVVVSFRETMVIAMHLCEVDLRGVLESRHATDYTSSAPPQTRSFLSLASTKRIPIFFLMARATLEERCTLVCFSTHF